MVPPTPANEVERMAVLQSLQILDTPADPLFDDIVALASAIARTPIALVSLVDTHRQWFKARVGLDVCETHRDLAFCAHAILGSDVLWVEDAAQDARFRDSPLVTGPPGIRFYAGAPLIVSRQSLGTICVISPKPRAYDAELANQLKILGRVVAGRLADQIAHQIFADVTAGSLRRAWS